MITETHRKVGACRVGQLLNSDIHHWLQSLRVIMQPPSFIWAGTFQAGLLSNVVRLINKQKIFCKYYFCTSLLRFQGIAFLKGNNCMS